MDAYTFKWKYLNTLNSLKHRPTNQHINIFSPANCNLSSWWRGTPVSKSNVLLDCIAALLIYHSLLGLRMRQWGSVVLISCRKSTALTSRGCQGDIKPIIWTNLLHSGQNRAKNGLKMYINMLWNTIQRQYFLIWRCSSVAVNMQ